MVARAPLKCPVPTRLPGQHVRVWRGLYWHHAIVWDQIWLIEFGGGVAGGPVRFVTWADFTRGGVTQIVRHAARISLRSTRHRAYGQLGRNDFNLLTRNCEHFATWCATGAWQSEQVETFVRAAGVLAIVGLVIPVARAAAVARR